MVIALQSLPDEKKFTISPPPAWRAGLAGFEPSAPGIHLICERKIKKYK
jgi:hypothetical protein